MELLFDKNSGEFTAYQCELEVRIGTVNDSKCLGVKSDKPHTKCKTMTINVANISELCVNLALRDALSSVSSDGCGVDVTLETLANSDTLIRGAIKLWFAHYELSEDEIFEFYISHENELGTLLRKMELGIVGGECVKVNVDIAS